MDDFRTCCFLPPRLSSPSTLALLLLSVYRTSNILNKISPRLCIMYTSRNSRIKTTPFRRRHPFFLCIIHTYPCTGAWNRFAEVIVRCTGMLPGERRLFYNTVLHLAHVLGDDDSRSLIIVAGHPARRLTVAADDSHADDRSYKQLQCYCCTILRIIPSGIIIGSIVITDDGKSS